MITTQLSDDKRHKLTIQYRVVNGALVVESIKVEKYVPPRPPGAVFILAGEVK